MILLPHMSAVFTDRQRYIYPIIDDQERASLACQRAQRQPLLDQRSRAGMFISQLNNRRAAVKRRRRHSHHITPPRPFTIREHMQKQAPVEFFALPDSGTSLLPPLQPCHDSTVTFWPRANVSASKAASLSIR